MFYALVSFAFIGGMYDEKRYVYKTDVKSLVPGDVVVVDGDEGDTTELAVFVSYEDEERCLGCVKERNRIIKKAHKNTLKSVMRKRVDLFKDIKLGKGVLRRYRLRFKNNDHLSELEVKRKIIRNLSISGQGISSEPGMEMYFFGTMQMDIKVKGNVIKKIGMHSKDLDVEWIRPNVLDEITELYIEQVVTKV